MDISIIIPLFNEEESLPELCSWIEKVMNKRISNFENCENKINICDKKLKSKVKKVSKNRYIFIP